MGERQRQGRQTEIEGREGERLRQRDRDTDRQEIQGGRGGRGNEVHLIDICFDECELVKAKNRNKLSDISTRACFVENRLLCDGKMCWKLGYFVTTILCCQNDTI